MWVKGSGSDLATMGPRALHRPAPGRGAAADRARRDERRGDGRLPRALPARSRDAALLDRDAAARVRPGAARPPHAPRRDQRARRHGRRRAARARVLRRRARPGSPTSAPASRSPSRSARRPAPTRTCRLVVLAKHGLVVWGDTRRGGLPAHDRGHQPGGRVRQRAHRRHAALRRAARGRAQVVDERARRCSRELLPAIRGAVSSERPQAADASTPRRARSSSSPRREAERLVTVGAPCPDHLVHTKRVPLWIPYDPDDRRRRRAARAHRRARRGVPRATTARTSTRYGDDDDRAGRPRPADRARPAPRPRRDGHDDEGVGARRATSTTARSR